MATITVEVAPGLTRWAHGDTDTELVAGQHHEIDTADEQLAAAVAAGVDAGALLLVKGRVPAGAVETTKQSLAKLRRADEARAPLYDERDHRYALARDHDERERVLEAYASNMADVAQAAVENHLEA